MVIFCNDSEIDFFQGILLMFIGSPSHWKSRNNLSYPPAKGKNVLEGL